MLEFVLFEQKRSYNNETYQMMIINLANAHKKLKNSDQSKRYTHIDSLIYQGRLTNSALQGGAIRRYRSVCYHYDPCGAD